LKSLFEEIASCSDCGNNIKVEKNNEIRQQGFCLKLKLSCASSSCQWHQTFKTSKSISYVQNKNNVTKYSSNKLFATNVQMVIAFREIGRGHRAIKSFTSLLNMPPPISLKAYNIITNVLHDVYTSVCKASMTKAAMETAKIREQKIDETMTCTVSVLTVHGRREDTSR